MKIMIFVEGTLLKPSKNPKDFSSYVPTEGSLEKVKAWSEKSKIMYLTSRKESEIEKVKSLLDTHGFSEGEIFFRKIDYENVEDYIDVINKAKPNVIIDDTCESIGFFDTIEPRIEKGSKIKAITVEEFGGLKDLPDEPKKLKDEESIIETLEMPHGRVFIVKFTKKASAGFLELKEGAEFEEHAVPVKEFLKQAKGECIIKIGDNEKLLSPPEEFEVPANKYHTHSNSVGETSLTFWMFEGDVSKFVQKMRGPD